MKTKEEINKEVLKTMFSGQYVHFPNDIYNFISQTRQADVEYLIELLENPKTHTPFGGEYAEWARKGFELRNEQVIATLKSFKQNI